MFDLMGAMRQRADERRALRDVVVAADEGDAAAVAAAVDVVLRAKIGRLRCAGRRSAWVTKCHLPSTAEVVPRPTATVAERTTGGQPLKPLWPPARHRRCSGTPPPP